MSEAHPAHLDAHGRARMVDVGGKEIVRRRAVAEATVRVSAKAAAAIATGDVPKGDVAAVARVAGIMAAKRTPELIALCHGIALDTASIEVELDVSDGLVTIRAECQATERTGVEMEALTAVSVAALNVWDMVKGIDSGVTVTGIRLLEKTKG